MMDFVDSQGNYHKGEDAVFPILTKDIHGSFLFLGTGFFISDQGDFTTAKHVLLNDKNSNKPHFPLYIVQSKKDKHYLRYVQYIVPHPTADIIYGKLHSIILHQGKNIPFNNREVPFRLSNIPVRIGETLKTFAFPNSKIEIIENKEIGLFMGEWFQGDVVEYLPDGRDRVLLPDACYQTSINILGGSSGGPVINSKTEVIGVNSTGYENISDGLGSISYITPINKIFEIKININEKDATIKDHVENGNLNILI